MRTALLSALEHTSEGQPRAFQRLGGRSLLEWQVDLARDLGCSRIICLGERDGEAIDAARRQAVRLGLEFHLIAGPLPLVGLLSADQELLVVADGLVVDRQKVVERLGEGRGVLTFPDEAGIAAGFERIDAQHAWAGVLVARAQVAERLADMPPDSDTISVLLRLALQAGTGLLPLGEGTLASGEWLLVRDSQSLTEREAALLDRSIEQAFWRAPGIALSRRLARRMAPEWLDHGPNVLLGVAMVAGLGAVALAVLEMPMAALAGFVAGNLALATAEALVTLRSRMRGIGASPRRARIMLGLVDIVLLCVLALPLQATDALERLFMPLMLLGQVRLAAAIASPEWRSTWNDRSLLALLLLAAGWIGVLGPALAVLCLLSLVYCLFLRRDTQITQA